MLAQSCYASSVNKGPILGIMRPRIDLLRTTMVQPSSLPESRSDPLKVLEIASGTGEHAAYFASELTGLLYQPTEPTQEMHDSIMAWSRDMGVQAPSSLFTPATTVPTTNADTTSATDGAATSDVGKSLVLPPVTLDVLSFFDKNNGPDPSPTGPSKTLTSRGFGPCSADMMICINMIHISPWACTLALFAIAQHCLKTSGLLMTYGPYRVGGEMVESNHQFDASLKGRNSEWGIRDKEAVEDAARSHGLVLEEACQMPSNNLCLFFRKL